MMQRLSKTSVDAQNWSEHASSMVIFIPSKQPTRFDVRIGEGFWKCMWSNIPGSRNYLSWGVFRNILQKRSQDFRQTVSCWQMIFSATRAEFCDQNMKNFYFSRRADIFLQNISTIFAKIDEWDRQLNRILRATSLRSNSDSWIPSELLFRY